MLKFITKSAAFSSLSLGLMLVANRVALAADPCIVNGQEVPCDVAANQLKGFIGFGIGFFLVMFVIGIAAMVFWIMMLVHAASHPVENRAMWIILMVFTGIIGALIYYFVVKRPFNKKSSTPPVMSQQQGQSS